MASSSVRSADYYGKRFQPTHGKQYEVGAKYQPANSNGLITIALFDLTKSNVQTRDPVNAFYTVQDGERRSRGVELEIKQEFAQGLNLLAQYTYIDSEITEDNDNRGNRAPDTPSNLASAWLDYKVRGGVLQGVGAGLGVRYVGATYVDAENSLENPQRTLVDGALSYDLGTWRLGLNVNNLLDKDYLAHVSAGYPGSRRTVIASLKHQF